MLVRNSSVTEMNFNKMLLQASMNDFQWPTQKIFMGGIHWATCGGHLYLVCAICDVTISRRIKVSKATFWWSLLRQNAYSSTRILLILPVTALNISAPRWISKENTTNATIQQFTTAKISVCASKQGSKPHSSLSQSNYLQLQNQAAVMSRRIHTDCRRA